VRVRLTIGAAALALAGAAALLFARSDEAKPAATTTNAAAPPAVVVIAPRPVQPPSVELPSTEADEPVRAATKIKAAQTIAMIGGVAITGRDLLAWRAGDPSEHEMTTEMFEALKQRAIDRAVVFAEARRAKLELSPAHVAQLAEVRRNAQARGETDVAQLDFEEMDARAHMLATLLLEKAGTPPPRATPKDIERYAAEHAGLGETEIRARLATELEVEYQAKLRAYLDTLPRK
jgi:hypothetical protein